MSEWSPGIIYMETHEADQETLTQHRCWNSLLFMKARSEEAETATAKGKPRAVRFLSEADYRKKGGR